VRCDRHGSAGRLRRVAAFLGATFRPARSFHSVMRIPFRTPQLAIILGLALACRASVFAAPPPPSSTLETPHYRIVTNQTRTNMASGDFEMPHAVHFYRPGTDAVGDRAKGNFKQGTVTLYGNVVIHDSGNAQEANLADAYQGSGAATLTCNQFDVDSKQKIYVATGNVHFSQGARSATAAKGILDRAKGTLRLEGDVHLTENGSTLSASNVDYNLNTKDADVTGTPAVLSEPANRAPSAGTQPSPSPRPSAKARKKGP
jgi:lipopolysaccharide export system protein LptA